MHKARFATGLALVATCVVGVACDRTQEKIAQEALAAAGQEGEFRLLDQPSRSRYVAPVDGRLTRRQVEQFLAVRASAAAELESGVAGQRIASPTADPLFEIGLDERLAREAGVEPAELLWVRERIQDARWAIGQQRLESARRTALTARRADLGELAKMAPDAASRELVDAQLAVIDAELAAPPAGPVEVPPATAANAETVRPFLAAIEGLDQRIGKARPKTHLPAPSHG